MSIICRGGFGAFALVLALMGTHSTRCVGQSVAAGGAAASGGANPEEQKVTSTTSSLPPPVALPGEAEAKTDKNPVNVASADFTRGIFVDAVAGGLKSAESIKKLVQDCRDAGFNTIYPQVRAFGDAYYNSSLVPKAKELAGDFDPLKTLISEAHQGAQPLKVCPLVVLYRVANSQMQEFAQNHVMKQHADWLTLSEDGSTTVGDNKNEFWLDPGVVAVQDHLALVAADIAKNYEIDGILLDRARYPDTAGRCGYNPAALERFKQEKKRANSPTIEDPEWVAWRRDQVTETVRKIREAVRAARPSTLVMAGAVTYGTPPANLDEYKKQGDPYVRVFQDWAGWCEKGLVDVNVLMNYKKAETEADNYEVWTRFALQNKGKAKVVVAVSGWWNSPKYALAMMLEPIFTPEASGVALYSYQQPAAAPATREEMLALTKQAFNPSKLADKAKEIADQASKATLGQRAESLSRLESLSMQVTGVVAQPAVAPQATVAPETPAAASASAATPASSAPSLTALAAPAASAPAAAAQPSSSAPSLDALSAPAGGAPQASPAASGPAAPSLAALSASANAAPASAGSAPSLAALATPAAGASLAAASSAGSSLPSLESLNAAGKAGASPEAGLAAADSKTAGLPSLGALDSASSKAAPAAPSLSSAIADSKPEKGMASLPSLSASSSSEKPLREESKSALSTSLPSLSALNGSTAPSQPASAAGLDSLPSLSAASTPEAAAAAGTLPSLDSSFGAKSKPTPAEAAEPKLALNGAPDSSAKGLTPLDQLQTPASTSKKAKSDAGEKNLVDSSTPVTDASASALSAPAPEAGGEKAKADATPLSLETQATPLALDASPAPVETKSPFDAGASREVAKLSRPNRATGPVISIPDYGGSTNYSGAPVNGSASPVPTFVAPSVLPQATQGAGAPGQETPIASSTPQSKSGTVEPGFLALTPAPGMRSFSPQPGRKPVSSAAAAAAAASGPFDTIVLTSGKEFVGRVVERGRIWKIQLPNGSVVTFPANKISTVRQSGGAPAPEAPSL